MKNHIIHILLLLSGSIFIVSCENSDEAIKALNKKVAMVDEVSKVEGYLSQGGKVKAKLSSPFMRRTMDDTTITEFPKALHVDFYNDYKIVESWLDSKYGKYLENVNKIYLKDSVRVVSINGDTLDCKDLWWDQNKELFYTDKQVILRSREIPYYVGEYGLEATQDLKTKTFKNTSGRFIYQP